MDSFDDVGAFDVQSGDDTDVFHFTLSPVFSANLSMLYSSNLCANVVNDSAHSVMMLLNALRISLLNVPKSSPFFAMMTMEKSQLPETWKISTTLWCCLRNVMNLSMSSFVWFLNFILTSTMLL